MDEWATGELDRIDAEELVTISVALPDGSVPKSVDIWAVRVADRLFIRSYNGLAGKWYALALETGCGRIAAAGVEKDVDFVRIDPSDEATNVPVDAAYRVKYADSPYAGEMSAPPRRSFTFEVVPVA